MLGKTWPGLVEQTHASFRRVAMRRANCASPEERLERTCTGRRTWYSYEANEWGRETGSGTKGNGDLRTRAWHLKEPANDGPALALG